MTSIASIPDSPVAFNPTTPIAVGKYIVASAAAGGFITPEAGYAVDGKSYFYTAKSADGTIFEYGFGPYAYSDHSLSRTTIFITSNGDQVPITWVAAPVISVTPAEPPTLETPPNSGFASGTALLFHQSAAPVAWTKVTTFNDALLRVVSGSIGSGGTNTFSTVMAQTHVGDHALTITEMPAHSHPIEDAAASVTNPTSTIILRGLVHTANIAPNDGTDSVGGGATHNHSILMDILYADVIIATKD